MVASTAIDAVRVGSSEAAAIYLGADSVWTANKPGMVLINPTSIAYSGTSATKGANGQVTFTAVTSLSLNGVFTAGFDNYAIVTRCSGSTTSFQWQIRLRAAGTDASGSDYTYQGLEADGTSVGASRSSSQSRWFGGSPSSNYSGDTVYLYGPNLAQPTAYRTVMVGGYLNAYIYELAGTHSLSTAYDGLTMFITTHNATGAVAVYGIRS